MIDIYKEVLQSLEKNQHLVLATVATSSGSTPRTSGSKMIIYQDGTISGTIGGGIVESEVIKEADKLFSIGGAQLTSYDLSRKENVDTMDLICGGKMQFLLEYIATGSHYKDLYQILCTMVSQGNRGILVGKIFSKDGDMQIERTLYSEQRELAYPQTQETISSFSLPVDISPNQTMITKLDGELYTIESIQPPDSLIIVGGGHVAKETAVLGKMAGFRVEIIDDREDFANTNRFPNVDKVIVNKGYKKVFDTSVNKNCYIVIVTRGHSHDKEVLAQALKTDAGYIGMIGSRSKRDTIYTKLMSKGFKQEKLNQVFCPIGLSINAETPTEIAVSIAGQLIQERANKRT